MIPTRFLPLAALAFAMLGDLLLYDAPYGLGTAITGALVLGWLLCYHRAPGRCLPAAAIALTGLLGMVMDAGPLDALLALTGISACAAVARRRLPSSVVGSVISLIAGLIRHWAWVVRDCRSLWRQRRSTWRVGSLLGWIAPLLITAVFAALFGLANPVIDDWWQRCFSALGDLELPLPERIVLWLVCAAGLWGLTRWRQPAQDINGQCYVKAADTSFMLRTLVLCNLLFAIQHLLDLRFLLVGAALPTGMTYAGYAQRGAYPLLATAILAAVFVLVCLRPGGAAERSRPVRIAVATWLGQNVLLCLTAVWRLALYIDAYGLTRWRLAAVLWLLLVALGLCLIVVRMLAGHDNHWLMRRCCQATLVLLGLCAVFNCDGFIANWNAAREYQGRGRADTAYLATLGPAALPALRRIAAGRLNDFNTIKRIDRLEAETHHQLTDWRGWTWQASQAMR